MPRLDLRLADVHAGAVKVDIGPRGAGELRAAHGGVGGQVEQGIESLGGALPSVLTRLLTRITQRAWLRQPTGVVATPQGNARPLTGIVGPSSRTGAIPNSSRLARSSSRLPSRSRTG